MKGKKSQKKERKRDKKGNLKGYIKQGRLGKGSNQQPQHHFSFRKKFLLIYASSQYVLQTNISSQPFYKQNLKENPLKERYESFVKRNLVEPSKHVPKGERKRAKIRKTKLYNKRNFDEV
jgi:hypothetical protein